MGQRHAKTVNLRGLIRHFLACRGNCLGLGHDGLECDQVTVECLFGDCYLSGEIPASRFGALLDIDADDFGELLYPFYEEQCGQRIASAKETLTVGAADSAMAKTLSVAEGSPVVTIERTALGYDRSPLEYRLSRAGAEGFRYQIDIS